MQVRGKSLTAYAQSQADAVRQLRKLLIQASAPDVDLSEITVEEWLEEWVSRLRKEGELSPTTLDSYEFNCVKRINPLLGDEMLGRLTKAKVRRFKNELRWARQREWRSPGRGGDQAAPLTALSHNTIRQAMAVLSNALAYAEEEELISSNPAVLSSRRVKGDKLSAQKTIHPVLTMDEVIRLHEANKDTRWGPFWTFMIFSGLRPGEALALTWADVDLEKGRVRVSMTAKRVKGQGVVVGPAKTDSSVRYIPIGRPAVNALRTRWQWMEDELEQPGRRAPGEYLVFPSAGGRLQDVGSLSRRLSTAMRRAFGQKGPGKNGQEPWIPGSWPAIPPHGLRHEYSTLMLGERREDRAVAPDPKTVGSLMGHSSSSKLTVDLYQHLLPDMQQTVIDSLDAILPPGAFQ